MLLGIGGFPLAWVGGFALGIAATALAVWLPETAARGEAAAGGLAGDLPPTGDRSRHRPVHGNDGDERLPAARGAYAEGAGLDVWSVTFLLFGAVVIVLRLLFATLPDRVPPLRLGGLALAMAGIGLTVVAVVGGVAGLLAGTALLAAGVAFMTPALFAATFARVPRPSEERRRARCRSSSTSASAPARS